MLENQDISAEVLPRSPEPSSLDHEQRVSKMRQSLQAEISSLQGSSLEEASELRELAQDMLDLETHPDRVIEAQDALFIFSNRATPSALKAPLPDSLINAVIIPVLAYSREGRQQLAKRLTEITTNIEKRFQNAEERCEAFEIAESLGSTTQGSGRLMKVLRNSDHKEAPTLLAEGLAANPNSTDALRQLMLEHPRRSFRVAAARALSGREEALDDLIDATRSEYKPLAFSACIALEGEQRAQSALREAALKSLYDGSAVLEAALRSLKGQELSSETVEAVVKILRQCSNEHLESLALEVLTGVPEAEDSLTELLSSRDHHLSHQEIALALRGTTNKNARAALLEVLQSHDLAKLEAAAALGPCPETLELLVLHARGWRNERAKLAAEALSGFSAGEQFAVVLVDQLRTVGASDYAKAKNLGKALTGNLDAIPMLTEIVTNDESPSTQIEAASAALAGSQTGREQLISKLPELDDDSRRIALEALGYCEQTKSYFEECLSSDDHLLKILAVENLMHSKEHESVLMGMLVARDPALRFCAAQALPTKDQATRVLISHGLDYYRFTDKVIDSLKQRPNVASILRQELEN